MSQWGRSVGVNIMRTQAQAWITDEKLEQVRMWAGAGWTDKRIAGEIGITVKTLARWREKYPALAAALEAGKEKSNEAVEASLYEKALGYDRTVTKWYKVKVTTFDPVTGRKISEHEELEPREETVHFPADVTAQRFWLVNRAPERWANRVEFEGDVHGTLEDYIRENGKQQ